MPDYAGAVAAIKAKLVAQWVDVSSSPLTPIFYVNQQPDPPFPPIDKVTGNQAPFLICEVAGTHSQPYTFGNAGNRFFLYDGLIILHVMVAINDGTERAEQLAVAVGEIFRAATFYVDANGSYIRTIAPTPPDGGLGRRLMYQEGVELGASFGSAVTIPFQYFHRA